MPIMKTALKSMKKDRKKHLRNLKIKRDLKTIENKIKKLLRAEDYEQCKKTARIFISKMDKAASRGIIHRNNASRQQARLLKKLAGK
ncbi:MAG: 30S ribosomal protein S20 [Candidatus Omnitrophota bacterium]